MHGQGIYNSQVGQGSYLPPPSFQHGPSSTTGLPPPPPLYPGVPNPQPRVTQRGPPSFHIAPDGLAYQHALLGTPQQGPPATPPLSGGSSQLSHSYAAAGQHLSWSQNVHQVHANTTLPIPSAYQMPSSQGYGTEQAPPQQPPCGHAPPPPPYNSEFSTSGPFESSARSMQQRSFSLPMGSLPPPPPLLPPPPPTSSPPRVPPLPSSPPLESMSKNSAGCSLNEETTYGNHMIRESLSATKLVGDGGEPKIEIPEKSAENNQSEGRSGDVVLTHPTDDSDMDIEG